MKFFKLLTFSFLLLSVFDSLYAETVYSAHTEVELVSNSTAAASGTKIQVGIRFKMDPQWHIYWVNPGDSGLAPKINWQLPRGWTAGPVKWPYPEKINQPPLASYGYEGEVFLISDLQIPADQPSGEVFVKTSLTWLACQVDCIPGKADLTLPLKISKTPELDIRWVQPFALTQNRYPAVLPDLKISAAISESVLNLDFQAAEKPAGVYFFPENPELIEHAAEQVLTKTLEGYRLQVPLSINRPENLQTVQGILFSENGWRGENSEKALKVDLSIPPISAAQPASMTLLAALLFAFLGGLILNLMPCVLPVLSIKILSFVREASENPREVFRHGFFFTAGVLVSFWFLAGFLFILKLLGRSGGWGFQLQSSEFITALIFVFFLFALNLLGFFEIGASLTFAGSAKKQKGFAGSFLSGIFAVVVAAPCTAPFMGAALGFSLTQPASISFLIFTFLGLGMATPYLLLCANPVFLKFVPKPGVWMVRLKQVLAVPLFLTCFWLLWVLSLQRGAEILKPLALSLLVSGAGAWLLGKAQLSGTARIRTAGYSLIFLGLLFGIFSANRAEFSQRANSASRMNWQVYSDERLKELLAQGKPVFIDFTAAWCLTCQVNERVALEVPGTVNAFREQGITPLKADWTSQDPEITKALARYGRNSIPLYVFYPAELKEPVLLPELLTPGVVLEAINKE